MLAQMLRGQFEVHREWVHRTARGERLLVLHGDQFDGAMACPRWLTHLGDVLHGATVGVSHSVNNLRRALGRPYWPLAERLKLSIGTSLRYIEQFEQLAAAPRARASATMAWCAGTSIAPTCAASPARSTATPATGWSRAPRSSRASAASSSCCAGRTAPAAQRRRRSPCSPTRREAGARAARSAPRACSEAPAPRAARAAGIRRSIQGCDGSHAPRRPQFRYDRAYCRAQATRSAPETY